MDAKHLFFFLVQSLQRLHLEREQWSVGISSSSLSSTCWEVCTFRPCVLPELGRRSIAPCQRWMIQFPCPCKGNRIFFITFPYSVYIMIAARICVLHEKVQWKKKVEQRPVVIDLLCEKGKNTLDTRCLSNIPLCVHFVHLKFESVHTFNTCSSNISPFRAQSHLDFIPSARCPFPQSRFCIIPLRSGRLKCSNPSSTFRQPCLTHSRVMVP